MRKMNGKNCSLSYLRKEHEEINESSESWLKANKRNYSSVHKLLAADNKS